MATITDVSKRAGVSRSTVSRVVAGNGYVSEANRKAIEAAIAELGYRPNTIARALRSNRSNVIGAVVVDIGTPYFANIVYGVQRAIRPAGKSLMVSSGYADQDQEARAVMEMVDRSCDGIVLYLERPMRSDVVEIIRKSGIPVVSIGHDHCPLSGGRVALDNFDGARHAMRYLLEQGHRNIVYLSGDPKIGDAIDRLAGVEAALAEFGMGLGDIEVLAGLFHENFGHDAGRALLHRRRDFTAVFAGADVIAAGFYLALGEAGLRVPEDVSVIGFDDGYHAKFMSPPLTTIRQEPDVLGERAAGHLLSLLADPSAAPLQSLVGTTIVVRSSVALHHSVSEVA
ncbi:LacI family DNA-binding transcriptional regulator [Devosia sediminis]|uniref:LacI family DNA-binding transcriptional regulator n=1 Tax=Devosia sediminis TaxID=2798801 RepID=A0A934MLV5_9HYPH|nr:LacI family DNA-binding transcriptional regulator [Devosia sediminis]MBJ3785041.1 LacI family DNA-binding transcriptional regulator [Devosia sediminis]